MKKRILILLLLISFTNIKSQFCSQTTLVNMGNITPTGVLQTVTGAASAKRYWTFNATAGCIYTLSTCSSVNSNDTYLRLYFGTNPTSAALVTVNDDNGPICSGTKASIVWNCTTSGAYSILLTNFSCANLSASTNLSYRVVCPVPPINNNCSGAINISSLPYTSPVTSNNLSTDDVPTSISSCGSQGSNIWYTVTGNGNQLTATTCDAATNFDTEIRVYTGSCINLNSMVEVVCNDDDGTCINSTLHSKVTWCSQIGIVYYISVGYFISGQGYGNFILNVTNGTNCISLPVELISFDGYNSKDYNSIFWITATETNNDYFTLERSLDVISWETIDVKKGAGTSHLPTFYEYKDYSYINDTYNYYRLTQTDYDGSKTYSKIIAVSSETKKKCSEYQYYDLLGKEINIDNVPDGIYIRKCDNKIEKIIKR